jgi:hypothetical protein
MSHPPSTLTFDAYAVAEDGARTFITSGTRVYTESDIETKECQDQDGGTFWTKVLRLDFDGFGVGTHVEPVPIVEGFGIFATKLGERGFSWEWFNVEGDVTQVHENRPEQLRVFTRDVGGAVELQGVEFLADVPIRYCDHIGSRDQTHQIVVRQGSVLRF